MTYAENLKPLALVLLIGLAGVLRAGSATPHEVATMTFKGGQICALGDDLSPHTHATGLVVLAHFKAGQQLFAFKKYSAACDQDV